MRFCNAYFMLFIYLPRQGGIRGSTPRESESRISQKKYGRSARILHYSISSSSPGKPLSVSIASSLRLITFISGLIYVFLIFSPPKINILLPTARNCKLPWQVQSSRLFFLALKIHTISRCTRFFGEERRHNKVPQQKCCQIPLVTEAL